MIFYHAPTALYLGYLKFNRFSKRLGLIKNRTEVGNLFLLFRAKDYYNLNANLKDFLVFHNDVLIPKSTWYKIVNSIENIQDTFYQTYRASYLEFLNKNIEILKNKSIEDYPYGYVFENKILGSRVYKCDYLRDRKKKVFLFKTKKDAINFRMMHDNGKYIEII